MSKKHGMSSHCFSPQNTVRVVKQTQTGKIYDPNFRISGSKWTFRHSALGIMTCNEESMFSWAGKNSGGVFFSYFCASLQKHWQAHYMWTWHCMAVRCHPCSQFWLHTCASRGDRVKHAANICEPYLSKLLPPLSGYIKSIRSRNYTLKILWRYRGSPCHFFSPCTMALNTQEGAFRLFPKQFPVPLQGTEHRAESRGCARMMHRQTVLMFNGIRRISGSDAFYCNPNGRSCIFARGFSAVGSTMCSWPHPTHTVSCKEPMMSRFHQGLPEQAH